MKWIEVVGHLNAEPMLMRSHDLDAGRFSTYLADYTAGDFHQFTQGHTGTQLTLGHSLISAGFPTTEDAHHLAMATKRPILKMQCLYRETIEELPTLLTLTRFRADRLQIGISF